MVDFPCEADHKDGVRSKFPGGVFSLVIDRVALSCFPLLQGQWPVDREAT